MSTAGRRRWRMDSATAALLGSLIGVFGTLLVTLISNLTETQRLRIQANLTEQAERRREVRAEIAEVADAFGRAQQSMEWITWFALNEPDKLDNKFYEDYNKEMKENWPRIVSSISKLAAYEDLIYESLTKASEETLAPIDDRISKAMVREKDVEQRKKVFRKIHEDLKKSQDSWRREIKKSMDQLRQ